MIITTTPGGVDVSNTRKVGSYLFRNLRDEDLDDRSRFWIFDEESRYGSAVMVDSVKDIPNSAKYQFTAYHATDEDTSFDFYKNHDTVQWYVLVNPTRKKTVTESNNAASYKGYTIITKDDGVMVKDGYDKIVFNAPTEKEAREWIDTILDYDSDAEDRWGDLFDVADEQTTADDFNRPVRSGDNIFTPKNESLSVKDYRSFYETSTSIDKERYPNFPAWFDYMRQAGKLDLDEHAEPSSTPGYYVSYISGYAGNGVNRIEKEWFRTEEERDSRAKELVKNHAVKVKTGMVPNFYRDNLQEATGDKAILTQDEMTNPSSFNLKNVARRAVRKQKKEDKEARAKENKQKYSEEMSQVEKEYDEGRIQDALETAFDALVPAHGKADTVAGELVRATMRLLYRSYNDGDVFYSGYGKETCGSSVAYLIEIIPEFLEDFKTIAQNEDEDEKYTEDLMKIAKDVVYTIITDDSVWFENTEDSRGSEYERIFAGLHEDEFFVEYTYDVDTSGDLEQYIENDCITWSDVEDTLNNWAQEMGGEVRRRARDAFQIRELDKDQCDEWEHRCPRYLQFWLNDLEQEFPNFGEDEEQEEDW